MFARDEAKPDHAHFWFWFTLVVLVFAWVVVGYTIGTWSVRRDAVRNGAGHYVLDENGARNFEWTPAAPAGKP